MQQKKIPTRMCVGCGEMKPKREMVRVVRPPEQAADTGISLDLTGKKPGRGAYICKNPKCLNKARKSRRIETALEISISEDVYLKMEEELTLG